MNQLAKFGVILAMICFLASGVLAVTYKVTKPLIDKQSGSEAAEALRRVLPEADDFVKKGTTESEYYEGYRAGQLRGYCLKAVGNGYGGYINMIVGIDLSGLIEGVGVLGHQETPGLGSKINEVRAGESDAWFLRQFKGKPGRTISMDDVDAITGATISSSAVVNGVNKAVNDFMKNRP